jgi:hypothetical protein
MKITIAETVNLKSQLEKKVNELVAEVNRISTEVIDKGEKGEIPDRNVDVINDEIEVVENHIIELKYVLRSANISFTIDWNGSEIEIYEALDLAKVLRARAERYKRLSMRKKLERNSGLRSSIGGGDGATFTVALYDPEHYKALAQKLEREANQLSALIEKINHSAEIDFDHADVYLV